MNKNRALLVGARFFLALVEWLERCGSPLRHFVTPPPAGEAMGLRPSLLKEEGSTSKGAHKGRPYKVRCGVELLAGEGFGEDVEEGGEDFGVFF